MSMLYQREEFIGKNGVCYTLRSPCAADAEKMIDYLKITAAEFGLSYPEEMNFTIKDEEDFIANYAEEKESIMITAFDGERLVGNASLSCVMDRRKTRHRATFGMAMLKSDWGQGLGKKILSELIAFAKQAGYEFLELEVAASNSTAVSLYQKMGFEVYGERPRSFKLKNGEYSNELLMILDLTVSPNK